MSIWHGAKMTAKTSSGILSERTALSMKSSDGTTESHSDFLTELSFLKSTQPSRYKSRRTPPRVR